MPSKDDFIADERLEVFGISARRRKGKPKVETGKKENSPGYH